MRPRMSAAQEPKVRRLAAGGNWIRNFSSALPSVVSRASEMRDPRRAPPLPRNRVRDGLAAGGNWLRVSRASRCSGNGRGSVREISLVTPTSCPSARGRAATLPVPCLSECAAVCPGSLSPPPKAVVSTEEFSAHKKRAQGLELGQDLDRAAYHLVKACAIGVKSARPVGQLGLQQAGHLRQRVWPSSWPRFHSCEQMVARKCSIAASITWAA